MQEEIDLKKYYLPEKVEGYDLFIGRNGEYYKVKKINGDMISHYEWAEIYLSRKNIRFRSNTFDALNLLIHRYGFIRYSHDFYSPNPILDIPNPSYNNVIITKEQIEAIYRLIEYNLEYLTNEQEEILDVESNILNSMREKTYQRIISKSI